MIITATGLNILFLGGIPTYVDGERIDDSFSSRYLWNEILLEGVPNLSITVRYTEATAPPGTWIRVRQLLEVVKRVYALGASSATTQISEGERKRFPERLPLRSCQLTS